MPPRNLTIIFFAAILSLVCYHKAERNRYATGVAEAMELVSEYYVEDVDSRTLFENAMTGMVSGLDQYSAYIGPDSLAQMNASLDQEFGGVGVEVEKKEPDQPLLVLSPLVGTPAYRAGIQAGDRVLAVDGERMIGMHLNDAVKLMRGKPGSEIVLTIDRDGHEDPFDVKIIREVITVDSVLGDTRRPDGSWDFHLEENPRIAYLRLTTFGQHTVDEVAKVLESTDERHGYEAIIIDLRGNAGGLLDAAVGMCDLFIDQGRIVSTNGRHGRLRSSYDATVEMAVPKDLPMVVLVNNFSASASEIVAACLQDHKRAIVVGERTWGKGTVQNILDLEGGHSALKLTTATYWRPSGKNIHRSKDATDEEAWGVRPNEGYVVAIPEEMLESVYLKRRDRDRYQAPDAEAEDGNAGEAEGETVDDPQLRRAINYLSGRLKDKDAATKTALRRACERLQLRIKA
ncbi:MAG: S41 family peptidase [Planctomycetaceae bacterium]|nr:S41 family peptidase [Planctomycetales bacterium]MCB9922819.1 S41 family peptidase [Planctomycetaceae bacterium]